MVAMIPCLNSAPPASHRNLSFLDALREAASIRGADPLPWVLSATPVVFPTPTPSRPRSFPSSVSPSSPSPSVGVGGDPSAQGWSKTPSTFEREGGSTTPSATPWEAQLHCKQEPGGHQEYAVNLGHTNPCTPPDGAVFPGATSRSAGAEECCDCSLSLGPRKRRHSAWGVPRVLSFDSVGPGAPTGGTGAGAQRGDVANNSGLEKQLPQLHKEHSLLKQQDQQHRQSVQNVRQEVQEQQRQQLHQQQRLEQRQQEQEQQLVLPGPLGLLLQIVQPQTGWHLSEWVDGEEASVGPTSALASPASSSCSCSASPLPRSKRAKVKEERTEDL